MKGFVLPPMRILVGLVLLALVPGIVVGFVSGIVAGFGVIGSVILLVAGFSINWYIVTRFAGIGGALGIAVSVIILSFQGLLTIAM